MSNNYQVTQATYDGSFPFSTAGSNDPFVNITGSVNGQTVYFGNAFHWSQIQLAYAANGAAGVQQLIQAKMLEVYNGYVDPVEQGPPYAPAPQVPIGAIPTPVTGGFSSVKCAQAMCGNWTA